jgi:hypothetical protein
MAWIKSMRKVQQGGAKIDPVSPASDKLESTLHPAACATQISY